jgi:opacity protein-like surface antigen
MPYPITALTTTSLSVDAGGVLVGESRVQYQIFRPGTQRISSTAMNLNLASAGLYFFDVELVSEGAGDAWNITADLAMAVSGYESDGYFLTTEDSNLTFSPVERAHLHLSRTILEVGVSDDPSNATQLSGQNLQLNYDQSSLVGSVSNFVTADTERVVCASPLARHLIPHFVRFDLFYIGGPKESELVPALEDLINGVDPSEFLTVSAIEAVTTGKGATAITNPLELIAVVHNVDRTVTLDRSEDKINTGRLAAFLPDVLNVKRTVT